METITINPGASSLAILQMPAVASFNLRDDGVIPNNWLPLVLLQRAFKLPKSDPARAVEELFRENSWVGSWRNGIYDYHHYHSSAHEVLGVYSGWARVQFGGEHGTTQMLHTGDVVIIPAGVAHKNLGCSPDFRVVGAYPAGQEPDMREGKPGERPAADREIARVPRPLADPVYGHLGPLLQLWGQQLMVAAEEESHEPEPSQPPSQSVEERQLPAGDAKRRRRK